MPVEGTVSVDPFSSTQVLTSLSQRADAAFYILKGAQIHGNASKPTNGLIPLGCPTVFRIHVSPHQGWI